jgi:fructosamine-3-kinase
MFNLQTDLALSPEQAEHVLSGWLGTRVRCTGVDHLVGGMINTVLRLRFDHDPYTAVIKLNQPGTVFGGEALILRHLHDRGFPCPKVYLVDDDARLLPYTCLLLETLPGVSLAEVQLGRHDRDRVEQEMADALVALHDHTREVFGPIDAPAGTRWADVLMPDIFEIRAQREIAARLPTDVLADVDRAIELAPGLLADQGAPTLIHGDIWAANVMVHETGDGWHLSGFVDPGTQYADVEMELAYLSGFNTVGPAFFDTYTARRPLRPGYERRWRVYWLRTYLIHVWLFGDQHYREMTAKVARDIVSSTG